MNTVECSCLCGGVEFICDIIKIGAYCHCKKCQKSHGTPFAAQLSFSPSTIQYHKGSDLIKEYASSNDLYRVFCSHCGSRLFNYTKDRQKYGSIAVSAIDSDVSYKVKAHVCVANKNKNYLIEDSIKQVPDFFGIKR
tara:strand:- start:9275 stop:9685 length:411 start_codon:yes stop_codon:yes gene_type:complete